MLSFLRKPKSPTSMRSYAQCGEDILAYRVLCQHMRIDKPTYVDIGAHDPVYLSNTYLFYKLGCRGLLIEPDPDCVSKLKRKRPKDITLAAGISTDEPGSATFYRMNQPTLNTFSLQDAKDACEQGPYRIVEEMSVPVLPIDRAIEENLAHRPHFVSVDAEGLDLAILDSYDYDRQGPELICVESAEFSENNIGALRHDVFGLLDQRDYFLFASTYLNGLFVSRKAWRDRVGPPPAQTLSPTALSSNTMGRSRSAAAA